MLSIPLGIRRQLIATFLCSLSAVSVGCMVGWAAPTLKQLRQPDSPVHLTNYQEGLVVSGLYLGQLLSPFPSGFVMHRLGPKRSLMILGALPTISWTLVYFSTSASMLIFARLLAGLWYGASLTIVPVYTAEVSEPHVRGIFGSFYLLNTYLGYNFSFIVAPYVSLKTMTIICGMISVLFLVLFSQCPESPYFHVMRKDNGSAATSLNWLRGQACVRTELELEAIKLSVQEEAKNQDKFLENLVALLTVPANRRGFNIVSIISILDKLSGISCIAAFCSVILPPRIGPFSADQWLIVINIASFCTMLFRSGLPRKFGHKTLLYISSSGISVSMFWTGVWYLLTPGTASGTNWVPLLGFLVFMCFYAFGLGPTVIIFQGEMFPSNLKGQASALVTMIGAFTDMTVTGLFPVVSQVEGVYTNFFLFAVAGLATLLFTRFWVIETEGKSLQRIQAELKDDKGDILKEAGESARLLS